MKPKYRPHGANGLKADLKVLERESPLPLTGKDKTLAESHIMSLKTERNI